MNNIINIFDEPIKDLELGDIIHWSENGKQTQNYMLYQMISGEIGLLNTATFNAHPTTFVDLEHLKKFLLTRKTDDQKIIINNQWCIYVP